MKTTAHYVGVVPPSMNRLYAISFGGSPSRTSKSTPLGRFSPGHNLSRIGLNSAYAALRAIKVSP